MYKIVLLKQPRMDVECTFDYNGERLVGSFCGFSEEHALIKQNGALFTTLPATKIVFDTQELEDAKMAYLKAWKEAREVFDAEIAELHSCYEPEPANEEEAQALYNAEIPIHKTYHVKLTVFNRVFAEVACGY